MVLRFVEFFSDFCGQEEVSGRMTVLSKFVCLTLTFIKLGAGIYQVNVEDLSPGCQYLEVNQRAGWWCCPFQSIPVEEYRGMRNMSERSYNYPRAECETLYPSLNITQNVFLPEASGGEGIVVWLIGDSSAVS